MRSYFTPILLAASCLMVMAAIASAQIAPAYTVTDLGNLGATSGGPFFPRYISANNQIVGVGPTGAPDAFSAFSSVGGASMTNIGGLGGNAVAFAVNASGVIVGQSEDAGITTATRWIGGVPAAVPGLAGPNNAAGGINDSGQIAGWMGPTGGTQVAYRLTGGTLENFGNLGGSVTDINGMNAGGRFVGNSEQVPGDFNSFRGFISSSTGTSLIDLGVLAPGHSSLAFGINDSDTVIGVSNFFQPNPFVFTSQGFIWNNGVMTEIPRPAGYELLSPSGINNDGLIVGRITPNAFSQASEAWIYDGALQLLTPKLTSAFTGWQIINAWEINDLGYIAAEALDPHGQAKVVLLTPVPEPGTLALVAAAGLPLAWIRRWRK